MTRFDSRIPAMWRLSVRLLQDHPEDIGGITSRAWKVGRHCFNTCTRIRVSRASAETVGRAATRL